MKGKNMGKVNIDEKKARMRLAMTEYKAFHRQYAFFLDEAEDSDIISWLDSQGNRSEVIRCILRKAVRK